MSSCALFKDTLFLEKDLVAVVDLDTLRQRDGVSYAHSLVFFLSGCQDEVENEEVIAYEHPEQG